MYKVVLLTAARKRGVKNKSKLSLAANWDNFVKDNSNMSSMQEACLIYSKPNY